MRIIAGQRRGLVLSQFDAEFIRPTKDIVKEFIYNCLANLKDISACAVCDLYAGTGSLGIEALSRGCVSATFVETDARAAKLIKKNIDLTGLKTSAVVIQEDAIRFLKDSKEIFDIILADPPYDLRNGNEIIRSVLNFRRLNPGGALILESSPKDKINAFEEYPELALYKQKKWGETLVTILTKNV